VLARPGVAPALFNSRLTQPLFTELANLLQNALFATEQIGFAIPALQIPKRSVSKFRKFFLYVSNLSMTNITIPVCALSESTINPEEQTPC
jgi:hypothetical protein